jgi:hypothetical protein
MSANALARGPAGRELEGVDDGDDAAAKGIASPIRAPG